MCMCVCVSAIFPKRKNIEEGLFQSSNDRVCSLFCAIVFALEAFYEKSLYDSRAPTLLSASIHFDLFQGRLTALHSIKGINTETEQITEIKKRKKTSYF